MYSPFAQSPLFIVEKALDRFFESTLEVDDFLTLLEQQHLRVSGWLDSLTCSELADFEEGRQMQLMGVEGSTKMAEALEHLHQAICDDDENALDQASDLLCEGHDLVEASFELCSDIESETEEMVASTISQLVA